MVALHCHSDMVDCQPMILDLMNKFLSNTSPPVWILPSKEDMGKRTVLDRLARGLSFEQILWCPENLQLAEEKHLDYVQAETELTNATAALAEHRLIDFADLSAPNKLIYTGTHQHL
jgi:hypothetical protein